MATEYSTSNLGKQMCHDTKNNLIQCRKVVLYQEMDLAKVKDEQKKDGIKDAKINVEMELEKIRLEIAKHSHLFIQGIFKHFISFDSASFK